ncbi:MAG: RNA 2',3'-cyclic phosphodiesterase [Thermoleophilia bacterium]|nr:RNA 2',3'-cyclic phosphodiesterase [Thermoleophilia bacterium]
MTSIQICGPGRDYPAKPRTRGRGGRERPRLDDSSFRLFMAVDMPPAATAELVRWQQEYLSGDRVLRLLPEAQLHITLVFLGNMVKRELELAAAELKRLDGISPFEVTITGIVGLPKNRRPRVIAAAVEEPSGRLAGVHDRLAGGLVEKKLYQREKRPYFPHITIARARGPLRLDLAGIQPEPFKFTAVRVTLYNSILKREGASHVALKTVQLI